MTIQNEARASYVGVGRRQIVEQTFWQIPWWRPIDPLAQTFMLTEERYITALDLFFVTKDPAEDVTVQIRHVTNGYPSMNVLTSKVLKSAEIKVAQVNGGEVIPIATKVTFPDPVFLQANTEYAIVVLTSSSQYRLHVARMANPDLVTKKQVSRQPYDIGVLFSSSNGSAWTAHQDMDLTFKLYGAKFATKSTVFFQKMTADQATHLILAANQFVPQRSAIHWEYSTDAENPSHWYPLASQDVTRLVEPTDQITIKGTLISQTENGAGSSPAVQQHLSAIAMAYKENGTYVSREMTSRDKFNVVTVYLDVATPPGTQQTVEFSVDNAAWQTMGSAQLVGQIDPTFKQMKYQVKFDELVSPLPAATSLRIRIKQSTTKPLLTPKARNLMVHTSFE